MTQELGFKRLVALTVYGRGDYGNIFPKIKTPITRFMSDVVGMITDFLQGLRLSFNCPTDNDDEYDRCAKGAYARLIKAQGYIVKRVTEIIGGVPVPRPLILDYGNWCIEGEVCDFDVWVIDPSDLLDWLSERVGRDVFIIVADAGFNFDITEPGDGYIGIDPEFMTAIYEIELSHKVLTELGSEGKIMEFIRNVAYKTVTSFKPDDFEKIMPFKVEVEVPMVQKNL